MVNSKKQVSGVIFTDLHIKENNIEQSKSLISQLIELTLKHNLDKVYGLGDFFTERKSQPLVVLKAFEHILDMFKEAGITLIAIPGNHDKVNYESEDSYLDSYQHHPNFALIRDYSTFSLGPLQIHMVPYFKENTVYMDYLNKVKVVQGLKNILLSHIALTGSINNDGSTVDNNLTAGKLKKFDKVYLGHYHDQQQVGPHVFHLASVCQNNFGENDMKGFHLLFSDGTTELVLSEFKKYQKVIVDLREVSLEKVYTLATKVAVGAKNTNVRFEFTGSQAQLKAIDKHQLMQMGIDVKTKDIDIEVDVDFENLEMEYTKESITEAFTEFCKKNELKPMEGVDYLQAILN